ncbi:MULTISPECIES: transcriptional repressor TraM [Sinorhizobium]|uniref:transcriptional repressor TraM n=1 Tax=Sinorhizobium medicae TaxID=110321 RepID=UPI001294ABB8|nr:transcriptional repressor TraM [Sinorhizobium medicae]MQX77795.1 transcriptional regulator [Sinorhizobium medicae]WQP09208.1 transcriptional repressor TraM [Sinorhizobium meliloti]WQP22772.1 transcriptional repressor TraM [Sinorhizobium meliloti]WQP36179.1 transcriptional repressor TraM [Sinorhizobium meliloti]
MFNPSTDGPLSDTKLILRPLIGLMSDQPPNEIEHHVVREIEKHRRLRDDAVMLEAQAYAASDPESVCEASRAYIAAMIAVHAQQTVVSTLLDILGHIPEMPRAKGH